MRYYFNITDGVDLLDEEGLELADLDAVKKEALLSSGEMLKDLQGQYFWTGEPWVLWVTDQPNGGGNTMLTLTLTSRLSA